MSTQYQVFVTPLISSGVYASSEIEISDWVISDNIGTITRAIDSTDYDIGIYAYNDLTLVCDASDGYLLDQTDSRSIFQFQRDQAKLRIVFLKDGAPLTTFFGIINESGSVVDPQSETVSLTIMSYDSIFKTALVGAGIVADASTFQQAFIAILNSAVGGVLHVNEDNINPVYNGIIDIGKAFDNLAAKDALDNLLLPSNSILTVDSAQNVYVKSRDNSTDGILALYGKGDLLDRENIVMLANYNNGLQRTFNLIQVTGAQAPAESGVTPSALVGVAQDAISIGFYGVRTKALTVNFITEQDTLDDIANALLMEFRYPKPEIEVTVATELVQAQTPPTDLLDLISINNPLSVRPLSNCRLPFAGITVAGDVSAPWPYVEGAVVINPITAWKVIEIDENPQDYTTVLKLRVIGTGLNDGLFSTLQTEDGSDITTESGDTLII